MSSGKLQLSILYLSKNKFDFCQPDKPSLFSFEFPKELVKDLEILNIEQFIAKVEEFIQNNNLAPCNLIIILAQDTLFEKDFPQGNTPQREIEAQQFLDNIPFENTSSQKVPLGNGFKMVATNAELYESIRNAFEKHGSLTQLILPTSVFGKTILNFDFDTAKFMLQKSVFLKQYSLLFTPSIPGNEQNNQFLNVNLKSQRNIIEIAIFAFLILLTLFLVFIALE